MEQLKLIEPTIEYDKQIQAFRQEFLSSSSPMNGSSSLIRFDNTQDWIRHIESYQNPETRRPDRVPITQCIFLREQDNKMIGVLQIRHYLNESAAKFAGHIGYSVCPSERQKGYATQMLELALPKCRELGIKSVLITCLQDNVGSRKTILNNGGVYESTVYVAETNSYFERYWIELE